MDIKKAIITAAGRDQRRLPLQTLVDRDGTTKPALCILLEEAFSAGIEEVGIVVWPGDEEEYASAAGTYRNRLRFFPQSRPLGYGHAVHCGREFAADSAVLLLVGDHLCVSHEERSCARQLVEVAKREQCALSAVQATHESKLPYYGVIGGRRVPGQKDLYQVERVLEKPTPTEAEQNADVPGLRTGHYLCFFGMHILTPLVMQLLGEEIDRNQGRKSTTLSAALQQLPSRERYLAFEVNGHRYDVGARYGLFTAQCALALEGRDRDEVLTQMLELLAQRTRR